MSYYWENHKKKFDGNRLAWFGESANEEFWSSYWLKNLSKSFYEKLRDIKLEESHLGKILSEQLERDYKILEAGCGAGKWVSILNSNGYDNTQGIDYSSELTDHINRINQNLNVSCGDALHIDITDNYFDAYLSFGVIEHRIEGPDPFIIEAFRVVKPGGKVIITVPCVGLLRLLKAKIGLYQDETEKMPFFQYGFQRTEINKLLEKYQFKIIKNRYIDFDRLWIEESLIYRKLAGYKKIRSIQKSFSRIFERVDGHMLVVVAQKSGQ